MTSQRSTGFQHTSSLGKFIGNGAVRPRHREGSAMRLVSFVSEASMRRLILLLGGILCLMMLTADPPEWTPYPMLSSYNRKCDERPRRLINLLTLRWLLTSNLRTSLPPSFPEERLTLPE